MIKYICDWCDYAFPLNCITRITLKNVYNKKSYLHICRECAKTTLPDKAQPYVSWTKQ